MKKICLVVLLVCLSLYAADEQQDIPPRDAIDQEIEKTVKQIQTEIENTKKNIEVRGVGEDEIDDQTLHVILTAKQKTILSNQISTPILSSQVSSQVLKIYKRMGEQFIKDELLILIDEQIYTANLGKAKEALNRAYALLEARTALYKDQIASYLDLKEAQALVASSEAEYVLAKTQLEGARVKAPYAGRVISLAIEEFELPQPGQALIEIENDTTIIAKILVPSIFWRKLALGKWLTVRVRETDEIVEAQIIRIGAVIDPASGTIAIDAEIDNQERHLLPGMTGTTKISTLKVREI